MKTSFKMLVLIAALCQITLFSQTAAKAPQITADAGPLDVIIIRKPGCRSCVKLDAGLERIAREHPGKVRVLQYRIEDKAAKILCEALCARYGVESRLHLVTPAVFFSSRCFIGDKSLKENDVAGEIVRTFHNPAAAQTPFLDSDELLAAERSIQSRFAGIGVAAVLAAGLVDGLNPCAFVTAIFLFSYLALVKYGRREVILVGLSFAGSVFVAYLAVGLGLMKAVDLLASLSGISIGLYYFAALLAFAAGGANIYEFFRIRKGAAGNGVLGLGDGVRLRINRTIRENIRLPHFILGAAVIGFTVSLLELACTGQTYAPTVLFILSSQGAGGRAVAMLVAYNIAFIVPLLAVIAVYLLGARDRQMSEWLSRNAAAIRLATGIVFVCIGILVLLIRP